jgi:hypothetical protein
MSRKYQTTKHINPVHKESQGRTSGPWRAEAADRIPERAPVGPTMLNSLPPKIAAARPPQKAVTIPLTGVPKIQSKKGKSSERTQEVMIKGGHSPPPAMANAILKGMFTRDTVADDERFLGISSRTQCVTSDIKPQEKYSLGADGGRS